MPVLDFLEDLLSLPKFLSVEGWPGAPVVLGVWCAGVLQCDSGLGVSPSFLLCVLWPGVRLSMKVPEAEACLAQANTHAAGPAGLWFAITSLCSATIWGENHVRMVSHPSTVLRKAFFWL